MDESTAPWLIRDEMDDEEDTAPAESPAAGTELLLSNLHCPACAGAGRDVDGVDAPGWSQCAVCGTQFRKLRPSTGQLARMRNDLFAGCFARPLHAEKRAAREQSLRAMAEYFDIVRGKKVALNAFGRSVVDVACGVGLRMRAFQDYGWSTAGTETSAEAYEYARRQTLDVKHGWLREADFGTARFDLALFCGGIGELPDPAAALAHLHAALVPDALVCVLDEPLAQAAPATPPGDLRVALFTADGLNKLFCAGAFSFVREDVRGERGTFWFQAKSRR